jgi:predicted amidohydrolase
MICYNYSSTSDVILEQVCVYCNSEQELTTISASDICYSCIEFLDTIVCTKCKTQKQKIARPCITPTKKKNETN